MVLSDFLNRHAGETAWLFGKGPSFASFDFKKAGPLRVAINDVIAHVPDCVYGFANDGVRAWRDVYTDRHILFQPSRCLHEFDSTQPGAVACQVVSYEDDHDDHRLYYTRERLAEKLCIRRGTLGSALQILHVMGVKTVYGIGIDGGRAHADGFYWRTELRLDHGTEYTAIRNEAIDSAILMGIDLKLPNMDHTQHSDGKVWIQFTSNCFADQIPYCTGQVVRLNPRIAMELITGGCAIKFYPPEQVEPEYPEKTTPENASLPMTSVENAMVKTSKRKPRK